MSASRAFIDVLVGKLTAYVDASSRPAPQIATPWWVHALDTVPVTPRAASRAYVEQGASMRAAAMDPPTPAVCTDAPVFRTPAELAAIQLLRRLGASSLTSRSNDADIRSAWRQLLRECHPDAHPGAGEAERQVLTGRLRAVIRARDIFESQATVAPAA